MILRSSSCLCFLSFLAWTQSAQPSAPEPVSAPLRELPWGQLNFLHTTDTHGWHAGHLQEPSYAGDWGDYISFAERLREKADEEGVDLLLIDTGDRIEGNGLFDASDPKGQYTQEIVKEQDIDVICTGNHELYKKSSSENEYLITVPNFHGNYLASNLDILDPDSGERIALAPRFRKFTTKNQGVRILAFGFLFDFTGNANNTFVEAVEETVQQKWFLEAIHDRSVDLFLVAGHVLLDSPEYNAIFKAIRQVQWDTPIQFFGGHTHIRDYFKYDNKAYGLESGRYMETIGFMSISGLSTGGKESNAQPAMFAEPKFSRRYIDNNLYSFHQHTSLNDSTFSTPHGRNVSAMIASARKSLNLDHRFGCAPTDLWTNRAPFPSEHSIFTWLQEQVFPSSISDPARKDVPRLLIMNTGGIRFDIFKGPFTVDTMYTVSPFTSGFRYIKDVPYSIAQKLVTILNREVPQVFHLPYDFAAKTPVSDASYQSAAAAADGHNPHFHRELNQLPLSPSSTNKNKNGKDQPLTPGYTTTDAAGSDGDDTIHDPITFYRVPNVFDTKVAFPSSFSPPHFKDTKPEDLPTVDLIYVDFIQVYVLLALKFLGTDYEEGDTGVYMRGRTMTEVISGWVEGNWRGEC
ncbi:MAG: hypothetical protein LQ338_005905 [Usnochroma carphineum]|nr:MAG: hypothetical protein LQ338_005905 [Usnochroma carphineum]